MSNFRIKNVRMMLVGTDSASPRKLLFILVLKRHPPGSPLMKKRTDSAIDMKWSKTSCPELAHSATSLGVKLSLQTGIRGTWPHMQRRAIKSYGCQGTGKPPCLPCTSDFRDEEAEQTTSQPTGHTPQEGLSWAWNPGAHPPQCLLQPHTDSNYCHVKCSVCKKSECSYPAEMKMFSRTCLFLYPRGNEVCWGSPSVPGQGLRPSLFKCLSWYGNYRSDFHECGAPLDTNHTKAFFPSVYVSKCHIFIFLFQKSLNNIYNRHDLKSLSNMPTEMSTTPNAVIQHLSALTVCQENMSLINK